MFSLYGEGVQSLRSGCSICAVVVFNFIRNTHLQKAGLRHRGIHALRHTFATNAIRAGVDVKTLGELIGHSKAAFTIQTYVHSNMDTKTRALEAINECRKAVRGKTSGQKPCR